MEHKEKAEEPDSHNSQGDTVISLNPGPSVTSLLCAGEIVEQRFKVIELIGQGGMGSVYKVEDLDDGSIHALKTLQAESASEVTWLRFQKEIRATQMLDHPSLLKVHHMGLFHKTPYFVTDYFKGETLAQRIKQSGPLSIDEALSVFIKACFALAHAHGQGVVHRDLKPSNIMIARCGDEVDVKIVDFGIAKLISAANGETQALTKTGEIFGTPYYMSPEQCLGIGLDHRSDIYSLGCVLFEALTGTPPFLGEAALSTLMKHQSEKPPSLKEGSIGRDFPADLERVVEKLLKKKPDDRFQNLFKVAQELARIQYSVKSVEDDAETIEPDRKKNIEVAVRRKDLIGRERAIVLSIVAVTAVGLAFFLGRFSQTENNTTRVMGPHPSLLADDKIAPRPLLEGVQKPEGCYSTFIAGNPRTRLFHFPSELEGSPGGFIDVPETVKISRIVNGKLAPAPRSAYGDLLIENFEPLGLRATMFVAEQPALLYSFRPDELKYLEIISIEPARDDMLRDIGRFKLLKGLNIRESKNFSDKCIKYLNDLPALSDLTVNQTAITGRGLLQLKRLRKLKALRVKHIADVSLLLKALEGSDIEELNVRMGRLSTADIDALTRMPNLRSLDVSVNERVNDAAILKLTRLENIEILRIHDTPVSPASIETLTRFPRLKTLTISANRWSSTNEDLLRKRLPGVNIYMTAKGGETEAGQKAESSY